MNYVKNFLVALGVAVFVVEAIVVEAFLCAWEDWTAAIILAAVNLAIFAAALAAALTGLDRDARRDRERHAAQADLVAVQQAAMDRLRSGRW
jgi:hypothetical protein